MSTRGIQPGTTAASIESTKLDDSVKYMAEAIRTHLKVTGNTTLTYVSGSSVKRPLPEFNGKLVGLGVKPDGGMWFTKQPDGTRKILAIFEAKHQDVFGNAHERWSKNFSICYELLLKGTTNKYVTFMTGPGAQEGKVLNNLGTTMGNIYPDNTTFHYAPAFNDEELFNIFKQHLGLTITFEDIKPYLPKEELQLPDKEVIYLNEQQTQT